MYRTTDIPFGQWMVRSTVIESVQWTRSDDGSQVCEKTEANPRELRDPDAAPPVALSRRRTAATHGTLVY